MTIMVSRMDQQQKIAEAIERSIPMLPSEAQSIIKSMLDPVNIAIVGGTLIAWAGSHFIGIGEIIDAILLTTGVMILGLSVFDGVGELLDFIDTVKRATNDNQLNTAARHFAKAVNILGISIISALLLRRNARPVLKRKFFRYQPMSKVGNPPLKTIITRPSRLPPGVQGKTDVWGNIAVTRNQSFEEQRLTLYHEWVHSTLSPRFKLFKRFRAQLRISAYKRSGLMKYLEEALAECYSRFKIQGVSVKTAIAGISFPVRHGYVTISRLNAEGIAIGTIFLNGTMYKVFINNKSWRRYIHD